MVDECAGDVPVGADVDALDVARPKLVRLDQAQQFGHRRVGQRTRRERLDRNARRHERPRPAQLRDEGFGVVGPRLCPEETARGFQDLVARRPADRYEINGDDARLRRAAGVKCLGDRPEVLPQPRSRTAGNPENLGDPGASSPRTLAAATAAPNDPTVPVE